MKRLVVVAVVLFGVLAADASGHTVRCASVQNMEGAPFTGISTNTTCATAEKVARLTPIRRSPSEPYRHRVDGFRCTASYSPQVYSCRRGAKVITWDLG
jgi:hypothetical protein